jgi:hypothetical protein
MPWIGHGFDFNGLLFLWTWVFLKKSAAAGPVHPDFGLMSRSRQPLFASLFRSEGFRVPLWNPSPP